MTPPDTPDRLDRADVVLGRVLTQLYQELIAADTISRVEAIRGRVKEMVEGFQEVQDFAGHRAETISREQT